jgi:hypothetical protein
MVFVGSTCFIIWNSNARNNIATIYNTPAKIPIFEQVA